jgi:enoyl reductase-like protein
MPEIEPDLRNFFAHWFAGLMRGIDEMDEPARRALLGRCGEACAASYTAGVFREARANSADMAAFLANLAQALAGAEYEWDGAKTIRVRYRQCGCDLVRLGLVASPALCECTVANLRANFQAALGAPVAVALETSILRGGVCCALTVSLE